MRILATKETISIELEVSSKYLALSSFHALIRYTEFGQGYSYAATSCRFEYRFENKSLRIVFDCDVSVADAQRNICRLTPELLQILRLFIMPVM